MTHRAISYAVSVLTVFALLPPAAASAAPASTATLTSAKTVFPSATDADPATERTPFTLRVNNNDSLTQVLTPINAISITFPPNMSAPSCADISGWQCVAVERPGPDGLLLKGGMITAGSNESFSFAGTVSAPSHQDANGMAFTVDVSSDGGRSYGRAGGDTTFDVRVLQVGPLSIADPNARLTGGLQDTTASYSWTDHSANGVTVNPQLPLSNGAGQAATRQDPFTPAGARATSPGSATFDIDTSEPSAANGIQVVTLQADAGAQNVVGETPQAALTIERSPDVSLNPSSLEINGTSRSVISSGSSDYTIRIRGSKLYPPAVLAKTGNFDTTLTLSAAGITPVTLELASTSATKELARTHNLPVDFTYRTTKPVGFGTLSESTFLDAEFSFAGTDDNGAPFSRTVTLEDLIEIDVDIPTVTIDGISTANPDPGRVKDGDQITITGTIASNDSTYDINHATGFTISLTSGAGFSATNRDCGEDCINVQFNNGSTASQRRFTATYTVPETADETTTTLGNLGSVTVAAAAVDTAGNTSPTAEAFLDIDNLAPLLSPRGNALARYEGTQNGSDPQVRVTFDGGGSFDDVVIGGCLPTQWSIPGVNVLSVRYWDGSSCVNDDDGPAQEPGPGSGFNVNDRILVLDRQLDLNNEIPVNYDAEGPLNLGVTDDVTDQANNIGPSDAASIVDGRIPNLPTISLFERGIRETPATDDYEMARSRQGCRDTSAEGCSTLAEVANYYANADVRTAVSGGRFSVDDILLVRVDPTAEGESRYSPVGTRFDYTEDRFGVPISTCAAPCERNDQYLGIRFVREVPRGDGAVDELYGPVREFIVSYDTVVPTLASAVAGQGDGNDVLVRFSEDIAAGYDAADDWSIGQTNTDPNAGEEDNEFYTRAQSVTPTDNSDERLIEAQPLTGYPVFGALYEFLSDRFNTAALRYEDYAGNFTPNGLAEVD